MSSPNFSRCTRRSPTRKLPDRYSQSGLSLIELLVGISIGLLVVIAAIGTLILSKGVSATVSESTLLQQQGSFALRVIGVQLRQAGSVELETPPGATGVVFSSGFDGFNGGGKAVEGSDGPGDMPDRLSVSSQPSGTSAFQARDCLGNNVVSGLNRIDSTFSITTSSTTGKPELSCLGSNAAAGSSPLVENATDLQIWYRVQTAVGTSFTIRRMTATGVSAASLWPNVTAVEVCLDLRSETPNFPESGNYVNCQGTSTPRNGYLHRVFRNIFDLRTQRGT